MTNHAPPRAANSLEHPGVRDRRLWFGLLAAPSAWIVQVSILAILVTLAGLLAAWRNWQAVSGDFDAWDRVVFMSVGGIIVSASFLVATIWAALIPAVIGACGGMR